MNLLVVTLCLLSAAAILCGAQTADVPTAPVESTVSPNINSTEGGTTGGPTIDDTGVTSTDVTAVTSTDVTAVTSTDVTAVTSTDVTAVTSTDVTNSSKPTVDQPPPSGGLSGGAIAGITIGTIAGVAALGGGIYGVLKYTNKI